MTGPAPLLVYGSLSQTDVALALAAVERIHQRAPVSRLVAPRRSHLERALRPWADAAGVAVQPWGRLALQVGRLPPDVCRALELPGGPSVGRAGKLLERLGVQVVRYLAPMLVRPAPCPPPPAPVPAEPADPIHPVNPPQLARCDRPGSCDNPFCALDHMPGRRYCSIRCKNRVARARYRLRRGLLGSGSKWALVWPELLTRCANPRCSRDRDGESLYCRPSCGDPG